MNDRAAQPLPIPLRVGEWVRPEIRALSAYSVAPAAGLIKLDANESPYPMPGAVQARIAAAVAAVPINRYPDGSAAAVAAALRSWLDLPRRHGLLLGNGSDELLQMIAVMLARPGAVMLVPEPTFVMYRMNALYAGMRFVGVPLRADFSLDIEAMEAAIARERPALVFLASPNNPTGNAFATADIERVIRATSGLVVVDEAYGAFAQDSILPRLDAFPNLLVLRTLSKIGMAALRLGYAIAAPPWIAELNKVRQPYNLDALTQAAAMVLLREGVLLATGVAAVTKERRRLSAALAAVPGIAVFPSAANFVLARVPDAADWCSRLRAAGILVKNVEDMHPLLAGCLRITVGTPEENGALLAAIETIA